MAGAVGRDSRDFEDYVDEFELEGYDLSDIPGMRVLNGIRREDYEELLEEEDFEYEVEESMDRPTYALMEEMMSPPGRRHVYRVPGDDVLIHSHFSTVDTSELSMRFREGVPEDLTDRDKALVEIHRQISMEPHSSRFMKAAREYVSDLFRS